MKQLLTVLFYTFTGILLPLFASSGDFENRLREAESAGDRARVAAICKEWYASGQYSTGLLNWNYNALMSVEQNALLFTQQESDTYPAMLLQYALDVRPDVHIISFQLLENQKYREILIGMEGLLWIPKDCSMSDFLAQVLNPRVSKSTTKPVYFGSMTNKNLLQADKEKLYLTGLALKFSPTAFDNVATLRYNFENQFRTDYLELSFEPETDPVAVARVNLNYIPALLLLHRHYSATGETDKAARLQNLSLRIARAGGRETEVRGFFQPEQPASDILTAITPKALEKNMKKVSDKLYAADTELTNGQYETFLTDLLKNKDFEQLDLCKTAKTDWISLLPKEIQNLPAKQLFKHGHPDSPECPVQNVSHEAAQRYCAWVTQVYNASPDKKKFKKVLFRLPTETEWITAARGGLKDAPYPWPGGFYVRNSKGCYLGNYDSKEPCGDCPAQTNPVIASADPSQNTETGISGESNTPYPYKIDSNDGGFFTVPAASYYPNKFGLYAVSGNVAEMIAEPGKAKGGLAG
ncbi:MAG: SUMF1/EgtB/PvdO family nonheme iron enzyme [Lewinellaceae bacterium]|nr:SUMF1/EgtB/PvdO family nonheme iron enzyme [Lewinellaceae bacterium]